MSSSPKIVREKFKDMSQVIHACRSKYMHPRIEKTITTYIRNNSLHEIRDLFCWEIGTIMNISLQAPVKSYGSSF